MSHCHRNTCSLHYQKGITVHQLPPVEIYTDPSDAVKNGSTCQSKENLTVYNAAALKSFSGWRTLLCVCTFKRVFGTLLF